MFNPAILSIITSIIGTVIGVVLGWFFTRKKQGKEVTLLDRQIDLAEMETVEQTMEIWKQLSKDLRSEYTELHKSFQEIKSENKQLKTTLADLKNEVRVFKEENEKMKLYIDSIKAQTT